MFLSAWICNSRLFGGEQTLLKSSQVIVRLELGKEMEGGKLRLKAGAVFRRTSGLLP